MKTIKILSSIAIELKVDRKWTLSEDNMQTSQFVENDFFSYASDKNMSKKLKLVSAIHSYYTSGFYAESYIVFAFPFVLSSVRMFVCSCVRASSSWNLWQSFQQSCVKVSQVGYISRITHQKSIIFGQWVRWKVYFHAMSFDPRVYVFSYFPFGFEGRIWDLIVSVPDHCLSFYFFFIPRVGLEVKL